MSTTPSTIPTTYVEPSATEKLTPGHKIANLFDRSMAGVVLQRLTDRTYWVQAFHYGTVFYVGDHGVLLFDALEKVSPLVTQAIASVTDLPVTAVVYSHAHADHIGDIQQYVDAAAARGEQLRLIASSRTRDKQQIVGTSYPMPTETVPWPTGSTTFEDLTIELHGFEWASHTDDHSAWLLKEERVVHVPDMTNPDQPPFWRFGASDRFLFAEENRRAVLALDWDFLSGGHGNVGVKADIEFDLAFMADLKDAVNAAFATHDFNQYADPSAGAHTSFMANWLDAVAHDAVDRLRPKYGELYGFEAATLPNAEMVAISLYENR